MSGTLAPIDVRSAAGLTLAGLVGGFALVVLGANVVRSAQAEDADIFGFLRQAFGAPPIVRQALSAPAAEPRRGWRRRTAANRPQSRRETLRQIRHERRVASRPASARPRYASLPVAPLVPKAAPDFSGRVDAAFVRDENRAYREALSGKTAAGWLNARKTLCVRMCDGYAFPVGRLDSLKDLPVHQTACATSCPGAETALFTLAPGEEDVTQARSLAGKPYGTLRTALAYRQKQVPACACHGPGQVALPRLPFGQDRTLRAGDIIAGTRAAYVLTAGRTQRFVTLRQDRSMSRPVRQQIERAFGGLPAEKVRVRLSALPAEPGPAADPASGGVRVVMPSPY